MVGRARESSRGKLGLNRTIKNKQTNKKNTFVLSVLFPYNLLEVEYKFLFIIIVKYIKILK